MTERKLYWDGKDSELVEQLQARIPDEGPVKNPTKNKALERFRKASNHYYRLFNDGDFKAPAQKMFGITGMYRYKTYNSRGRKTFTEDLYQIVDKAMETIVEAAVIEQGIQR